MIPRRAAECSCLTDPPCPGGHCVERAFDLAGDSALLLAAGKEAGIPLFRPASRNAFLAQVEDAIASASGNKNLPQFTPLQTCGWHGRFFVTHRAHYPRQMAAVNSACPRCATA